MKVNVVLSEQANSGVNFFLQNNAYMYRYTSVSIWMMYSDAVFA
jgi:hypothetical protein